MRNFIQSISKIFKNSIKAFEKFPVVIANAFAFSIVTIIRIHLDWPEQEAYNFLFNCLHWSFALGAIFSLAAITAVQSKINSQKSFIAANLLGILAMVITFLILYFSSGTYPSYSMSRYQIVSDLAAFRVSVAIFISFLTFMILAGYPKDKSDFSKSFFMTHKAFFIALIYGLVIMGGTSGVAEAIKVLLYKGLSSKIYAYIGTLSGFLAFTIFVGYFPDFRKGVVDEQREVAQKQPRFVEVLLEFIITPIMLALTCVLILWASKTIMEGMKAPFERLSGIATSYAIGGIWLHIMVTHNNTGLAKFYKKVYPFAVLFILAFEAWALVIQLQKYGLKTTEYFFALLWIVTLPSAILLLIRKEKAHHSIIILTCAIAVVSVLPFMGYHALPVTAQVNRLEKLLISQEMLKDNKIVPATAEPEQTVREYITDAVDYLANSESDKLPSWFDKSLRSAETFETTLGFKQTYPINEGYESVNYTSTLLYMPHEAIDIRGYRWAINMQDFYGKSNESVTLDGERGIYEIYWMVNPPYEIPLLKILLNDKVIVEQDMNDYLDKITKKFLPGEEQPMEVPLNDMSLKIETSEISIMLIFNNVEIVVDPQSDTIIYGMNLYSIYLNEKP
ncbi:MAG: DUF4153 domain-containing protein [Sedimentibacter sp.]|uniref:DUF4153 domain-containing protein n=1 Tax=Sedimentibacter sp. TaxID=1960295 RepID=UPI002982171B|nr:DUF4153 domain-containing protein [Sedimentibacter sp.]MDW5300232.1 DUF4153 domain-containing protein [Sedimentibacter sp.]